MRCLPGDHETIESTFGCKAAWRRTPRATPPELSLPPWKNRPNCVSDVALFFSNQWRPDGRCSDYDRVRQLRPHAADHGREGEGRGLRRHLSAALSRGNLLPRLPL